MRYELAYHIENKEPRRQWCLHSTHALVNRCDFHGCIDVRLSVTSIVLGDDSDEQG